MNKEQIKLLAEKQKAIEERECVIKVLKEMIIDVKQGNLNLSYYMLRLRYGHPLIDNKKEIEEQLYLLLNYTEEKLKRQQEELNTYILSKKIEE